MEEEIDIEEHDLLDNPAIKNIFPDLSLLKKEISEFGEEAPNIKIEPDVTKQLKNLTPECSSVPISNGGTFIWNYDFPPESKNAQPSLFNNKIILGSKPSKIEFNENEKDPFSVKVTLMDIKHSLETNDRFCNICLTIFPTKDNLELHNMVVHPTNSIVNSEDVKNKMTIGSISKSYECAECSEIFPQHSLLRRHLINVHRKKYKSVIGSYHTSNHQLSSPIRKKIVNSTKLNQCFHCKVSFSSKKLLIEHIYTVIQSEKGKNANSSRTEKDLRNRMKAVTTLPTKLVSTKRQRLTGCSLRAGLNNLQQNNVPECHKLNKTEEIVNNSKSNTIKQIFQCIYCSYMFIQKKYYFKHIEEKHKDSSRSGVNTVTFTQRCKYCSHKSLNMYHHNIHMQQYHKKYIGATRIHPKICLPKIDSILSIPSLNNLKFTNMEEVAKEFCENPKISILNEKKCSISVNKLILKSILFKCKRCDIHFVTADAAMDHAGHMELLINWKCFICNKIFKKVDEELHNKQHNFSDKFTVLELSESQLARVLYKCLECTVHFNANGYLTHFKKQVPDSGYCQVCDILIDQHIIVTHEKDHSLESDFPILNADVIGSQFTHQTSANLTIEKNKTGLKFCLKFSYCETCNSFVSKRGKSEKVHKSFRCANIPTTVCTLCGLVLSKCAMKSHRLLHRERKGIRLKDFSFYDFVSGVEKVPPIPKYPKCKNCDVHFTSKYKALKHTCNEEYLTCCECNIKLSEPVFKLHMSFHYYSKSTKSEKDLNAITFNIRRQNTRSLPQRIKNRSAEGSAKKLVDIKTPKLNCAGLINSEPGASQPDEKEYLDTDNLNQEAELDLVVSEEKDSNTNNKESNSVEINQEHTPNDLALFNVLYCCIHCRITIDTYDGVIEHCQNHLCAIDIETFECKICELHLDRKSYENHKDYHESVRTTSFELLQFDIFYFALDNKIWLKHLFKNIESERSQKILSRSIFKYSGKMKMQVIQEGPSDLTVYKCNSCFVIVDPDSLLTHVENSCFKTRKIPCSYCGLPFMSFISLKNHLNIHKKKNISLKSYRIVLINQEKDKKSNKIINAPSKYFLLYECRNCKGIVDFYQRHNHTLCNDKDLKKCLVCDLLIYNDDYNEHQLKHDCVSKFVPKNMKIILFGQGPTEVDETPSMPYSFDGIIEDFTFFQCVKCGICLEKSPIVTINHHTCYEDSLMSKCPKCELKILKTKFARHTKIHEMNVHFERSNMNIVPYDYGNRLSKFVPACLNMLDDRESDKTKSFNKQSDTNAEHGTKLLEISQKNTKRPHKQVNDSKISEKTVKLLKCTCGLHFLDKTTLDEHIGCCASEKSKQNCSKCHLLFTPAVLFSHLLLHHGDKKHVYNFKVVEMSKKKSNIVILYRCVNCETHFLDNYKAMTHFANCNGTEESDRKQCEKCLLFISNCSITQHETLHHDERVADIEILDVNTTKPGAEQNETDARSIDDVIEEADFVKESKYNISEDSLSQIDLSRYSNSLFKCDMCNTHFLTEHTLKRHSANNKHVLSPQETCNICKLRFSLHSLTKHIYIHHIQMNITSNDLIIKSNIN